MSPPGFRAGLFNAITITGEPVLKVSGRVPAAPRGRGTVAIDRQRPRGHNAASQPWLHRSIGGNPSLSIDGQHDLRPAPEGTGTPRSVRAWNDALHRLVTVRLYRAPGEAPTFHFGRCGGCRHCRGSSFDRGRQDHGGTLPHLQRDRRLPDLDQRLRGGCVDNGLRCRRRFGSGGRLGRGLKRSTIRQRGHHVRGGDRCQQHRGSHYKDDALLHWGSSVVVLRPNNAERVRSVAIRPADQYRRIS